MDNSKEKLIKKLNKNFQLNILRSLGNLGKSNSSNKIEQAKERKDSRDRFSKIILNGIEQEVRSLKDQFTRSDDVNPRIKSLMKKVDKIERDIVSLESEVLNLADELEDSGDRIRRNRSQFQRDYIDGKLEDEVREYLNDLKDLLYNHLLGVTAKKQETWISKRVAEIISIRYHRILGKIPGFSRSDAQTPFSKVCMEVESYFKQLDEIQNKPPLNLKLGLNIQEEAVKRLPKKYWFPR